MQAIEWLGNKYEIDQDKCVQCGLCAKVCHTASIIDTEADLSVPAHQRIIKKADVVVCGSGTGLVAAVRAAMLGKKVILLEKSSRLGGNTDYAHAYFPIYTKWHEEAGMPDVREEAIQHYLEVTNHVLEPDVVRTAVYATGEFFDWLCTLTDCHKVYQLVNLGDADAHGPIYGPGLLDFPKRIVDNLNCRDDAIGPGWGGTFVKYTMLETIEKLGLDVEIYTEHTARHLLLDDSGKITGVLAENPGGETQINAPVGILATGGFGKSDEKLREFTPWFFAGERPFHRFSVPGDTGDGIDMLRELGVEPNPERMFISQFGPKHHPFSNVLADIALEPEMLQVNLNGKRWVDETGNIFAMREIIHEQPQERSWAIHTRDTYEKIAQRFIKNPAFASKAYLYETWEEELLEEASLPIPPSFAADTLEELAQQIGMPADALVETVGRYNQFCANGVDEDFGKQPPLLIPLEHGPYYAVMGQRFSEAALGGLMVDGQCRVLRNDGSHIPGLYGVGDATSAMHRKDEMAVISELTWGVASAFASGTNAVSYIDEKEALSHVDE
jgi:fumarate reductase flavoprotein subunit